MSRPSAKLGFVCGPLRGPFFAGCCLLVGRVVWGVERSKIYSRGGVWLVTVAFRATLDVALL